MVKISEYSGKLLGFVIAVYYPPVNSVHQTEGTDIFDESTDFSFKAQNINA